VGRVTRSHRGCYRRPPGKLSSGGVDLDSIEQKALHYTRLHEHGYQFVESGRIGDLTQRQIKLLQLGDLVKQDLKRRSREQSRNPDSLSHKYFDADKSRREAFAEFQ